MRATWLTAVPLLLTLATPAPAQDTAPSRVRVFRLDAIVEPDGRSTQTIRVEIAVTNDAAARREAQQAMTYSADLETMTLIEGYTRKPDGRRLPVLPGAVRTQLAPGTPNLPAYANRRQVVAVMPDAAGGDVLVATWRREVRRPIFPGRFSLTTTFARTAPWDDAEVTVSLPAGTALTTEAFGPDHTESEEGDRRIHRWRWRAPSVPADTAALSPLDRLPRLFASTFPDWRAFSRDYAALALPKAEVTPRIRALAEEITAGSIDRREEARRIYEWVTRRIRWVAIYVGEGTFVPHAAEEVLANGYGDCKDQVVLLLALLRARDIVAEPVLVNLNPTYRLSGPPTLTAFNHVITHLPEWDLYADTTAGAPFGTMLPATYGKPVLHVRPDGAEPSRTPVLPPGLATTRHRTTMRLDPDGGITGESVTEASGPPVATLRRLAGSAMGQGTDRAAAAWLRAVGQTGTGTVEPAPLDPPGPTYAVTARFVLEPRPGLLEGDAFALPAGVRMLAAPGDGALGPISARGLPATEPTPCHAGEQVEESSLTLPPGLRPARLPRARTTEHESFSYESRWSFEDGAILVRRRLVSRVATPLCEGPLRVAAARLLDEVRRDHDTRIELEAIP